MSATMRDVGFGVHVITVMAACFLAALALGRRMFSEPGPQIVVGAIGMLIALLVETGLFVIQDSRAHAHEQRAAGADKKLK
jgi:divalent metal cation (Fe/Co/Zn/Cd) transporter